METHAIQFILAQYNMHGSKTSKTTPLTWNSLLKREFLMCL